VTVLSIDAPAKSRSISTVVGSPNAIFMESGAKLRLCNAGLTSLENIAGFDLTDGSETILPKDKPWLLYTEGLLVARRY
jgi:hypothetical protein